MRTQVTPYLVIIDNVSTQVSRIKELLNDLARELREVIVLGGTNAEGRCT
jgi:hypothetical protein